MRCRFPSQTICSFYGVEPRFYSLQGCKRWEANADHIEALADDNTTALLVCNPGNPTGQNYSEQHIRSLVQVADRLRLPIIADEVRRPLALTVFERCLTPLDDEFLPIGTALYAPRVMFGHATSTGHKFELILIKSRVRFGLKCELG